MEVRIVVAGSAANPDMQPLADLNASIQDWMPKKLLRLLNTNSANGAFQFSWGPNFGKHGMNNPFRNPARGKVKHGSVELGLDDRVAYGHGWMIQLDVGVRGGMPGQAAVYFSSGITMKHPTKTAALKAAAAQVLKRFDQMARLSPAKREEEIRAKLTRVFRGGTPDELEKHIAGALQHVNAFLEKF